jgi:dimethylaniline monooxygenase (N-oxide forming)
MSELPTAALTGTVSSGIAGAKALHGRGVRFDCFERSDRAGGNGVFADRSVAGV